MNNYSSLARDEERQKDMNSERCKREIEEMAGTFVPKCVEEECSKITNSIINTMERDGKHSLKR